MSGTPNQPLSRPCTATTADSKTASPEKEGGHDEEVEEDPQQRETGKTRLKQEKPKAAANNYAGTTSASTVAPEKKWADIEAEEDFEPSFVATCGMTGFETKPDKDGIKFVTNYTRNSKGETIKIEKKVKVTRKHTRINRAVYARKERMVPFGLEAANNGEVDEKAYTVRAIDDYIIEVPKNSKSASFRKGNNDLTDDYYFMDLNVSRPTRDLKLKFKSLRDDDDTENDVKSSRQDNDKGAEEEDTGGRAGGRYVPPAKRAGGETRSYEQQQKEECTVRVTNLSEDVKETDLTELFGTAGKIHRIYLAKHKETKFSKGFAFITYTNRTEASKAIEKLNRHGYDNLLLNVEWARPSNRER